MSLLRLMPITIQDLFKKIRGIMNKMTPSMFEKLYIQIAALPIDDENSLSGCTEILFEKVVFGV